MLSTDAKRAGNIRHQSKLDRIVIQPYKEDGQRIRSAANQAGQSIQAYILDAVFNRIAQDETAPESATEATAPPERPATANKAGTAADAKENNIEY